MAFDGKIGSAGATTKIFTKLDSNGDGQVTKAEAQAGFVTARLDVENYKGPESKKQAKQLADFFGKLSTEVGVDDSYSLADIQAFGNEDGAITKKTASNMYGSNRFSTFGENNRENFDAAMATGVPLEPSTTGESTLSVDASGQSINLEGAATSETSTVADLGGTQIDLNQIIKLVSGFQGGESFGQTNQVNNQNQFSTPQSAAANFQIQQQQQQQFVYQEPPAQNSWSNFNQGLFTTIDTQPQVGLTQSSVTQFGLGDMMSNWSSGDLFGDTGAQKATSASSFNTFGQTQLGIDPVQSQLQGAMGSVDPAWLKAAGMNPQ